MSEVKDQLCTVQRFGCRGNIFCNVPWRTCLLTDDTDNDNDTDDNDNDNDTDDNSAQFQKEGSYMSRRCRIIINVCMRVIMGV